MESILGLLFMVAMCIYMTAQTQGQKVRRQIDELTLRRLRAEQNPQEKHEYDKYMEEGVVLGHDDKSFIHPPAEGVN